MYSSIFKRFIEITLRQFSCDVVLLTMENDINCTIAISVLSEYRVENTNREMVCRKNIGKMFKISRANISKKFNLVLKCQVPEARIRQTQHSSFKHHRLTFHVVISFRQMLYNYQIENPYLLKLRKFGFDEYFKAKSSES